MTAHAAALDVLRPALEAAQRELDHADEALEHARSEVSRHEARRRARRDKVDALTRSVEALS